MARRRKLFPRSRRRRSTGGDAAAGILILGGIAVAALGVYLLVIGAIALIGWLVAIASKRAPNHAAQFIPASIPSAAPPPNQQYHVVLPVDPAVFDDTRMLESTASSVFAAWARQLPKAPSDPRGTLRSFTLRKRLIGRLTTKLDGRRFVWKAGPYRGRDRRDSGVPMDPSSLDPYNPPGDLRGRSSYLSLCAGCGGDGRISCTTCGGSSRVVCPACGGAGKVHGTTKSGARRLLNCKECKGKASLACDVCSKGTLECSSCQRSGRLEHWLEVEGGPRDGDIQVEPDGDVTRAFVWGKDGVPATHDEIVRDARVVCSVTKRGPLEIDDLPEEVSSEWRRTYWEPIQARLQPGERVVSQTFTFLEVPSIEVTYALGSESQAIELEGLRMLAPPVSSDQLFTARAGSLRRLAYVLGGVPLVVALAYLARGSYFLGPAAAGVVFCAALSAAVIYGVIWHSSLHGGARKWLAGAVLPVAAATTLAIIAEPSESAARQYIAADRLTLAKNELAALGDPADPELVPLWADLNLKEALASTSCRSASDRVSKIGATTPQRAKGQAHADALALAAAEATLKSGNHEAVKTELDCASEAVRNGPRGRQLQAQAHVVASRSCLGAKDWPCVIARANDVATLGATADADAIRGQLTTSIRSEVDRNISAARTEKQLATRVQYQRAAIDLWSRYLPDAERDATLKALKATSAVDEQAYARQEQIAQQRREAEEKRQRELEAREERKRAAEEERQRRREEAAARRSEPQGLLCCDGSLSPTCSCGGSHQGCCSHHGGVCGCR